MKRIVRFMLLVLCCVAAFGSARAAMTARSAFTTAPSTIFPMLKANLKLDMLDYFDSGSNRPVFNQIGAETMIVSMDDDEAFIKLGSVQNAHIYIIPYGKWSIIMLVKETATPTIDADIRFYDSRWREIDEKLLIKMPELADWTGKLTSEQRSKLENALPFIMYSADYNNESGELTLKSNIGDFVATEDMDFVKGLLKPEIVYRWTGKKFKLQK